MATRGKSKASKAGSGKANGTAVHMPPAPAELRNRARAALTDLRDALWVAERLARGEGSDCKGEHLAVEALERAVSVLRIELAPDLATRRVDRAIKLLDSARRRTVSHRRIARVLAEQEDAIRARRADALSGIPPAAWAKAIREWRGVQPIAQGRPKPGAYRWNVIVWEMLHEAELTSTKDSTVLLKNWKRGKSDQL